jgi:periplasmic protein TonB
MFDELVVSGDIQKTHKPWCVVLSATVQAAIVGVMILIPLIYTEALPKGMLNTFLVAPAPPPPPPPPPQPAVKEIKAPKIINIQKMTAPTVIPKNVALVKDEAPVIYTNSNEGVAGGTGNVLGGLIGSGPTGPPPPPKTAIPSRIRVGGNVEAASLINKTTPQYPPIAKTAHVSGTVVLHAIISKDGTVQELQYVSGPPLLMKAAMDAAKEWRYKPTMLNGEAVEVETTINVVFTLG